MPKIPKNTQATKQVNGKSGSEVADILIDLITKSQEKPKTAPTPKTKARSMDAFFGDTGVTKFGTLDPVEFENKLKKLSENKADLAAYAAEHGFRLNDDAPALIKKLTEEFNKHVNAYKPITIVPKKSSDFSQSVKDFMAEGR